MTTISPDTTQHTAGAASSLAVPDDSTAGGCLATDQAYCTNCSKPCKHSPHKHSSIKPRMCTVCGCASKHWYLVVPKYHSKKGCAGYKATYKHVRGTVLLQNTSIWAGIIPAKQHHTVCRVSYRRMCQGVSVDQHLAIPQHALEQPQRCSVK